MSGKTDDKDVEYVSRKVDEMELSSDGKNGEVEADHAGESKKGGVEGEEGEIIVAGSQKAQAIMEGFRMFVQGHPTWALIVCMCSTCLPCVQWAALLSNHMCMRDATSGELKWETSDWCAHRFFIWCCRVRIPLTRLCPVFVPTGQKRCLRQSKRVRVQLWA